MTTLPRLRAEVARRYAALDLPVWPARHPDGAPPREEEYSRVTDPQRYRIAAARARVWAEVLSEVGAVVEPDPVRGIPLDEAGRADLTVPVDQAVVRAVGAGVSLRGRHGLRRRDWHVRWRSDGTAEGQGRVPGWPFEALTDACRDLAAGGRPRLPRGTEATVRAGWFPEA